MTTTIATRLRVYHDADGSTPIRELSEGDAIAGELARIGVRFERWAADVELVPGASQDDVIGAYASQIAALKSECGYTTVDVIRLERGTPNTEPIRQKFLNEHAHSEDEVRFFVEGRGAFYLHANGHVYQVVCVRNDLISVPAGTKHWFDMGPDPEFTAIRLFTDEAGWVANFTGDTISERFPKLDQ